MKTSHDNVVSYADTGINNTVISFVVVTSMDTVNKCQISASPCLVEMTFLLLICCYADVTPCIKKNRNTIAKLVLLSCLKQMTAVR